MVAPIFIEAHLERVVEVRRHQVDALEAVVGREVDRPAGDQHIAAGVELVGVAAGPHPREVDRHVVLVEHPVPVGHRVELDPSLRPRGDGLVLGVLDVRGDQPGDALKAERAGGEHRRDDERHRAGQRW